MGFRVYWKTVKSMDYSHETNQDSLMFSEYAFMSDGAVKLMIVADGMGGLVKGEEASRNAVTGFLEKFYSSMLDIYLKKKMDGFSLKYTVYEVEDAMVASIQAASEKVCRDSGRIERTGTTISAVCVVDDYAVAVNVGDSPIYFYRKKSDSLRMVSKLDTLAEMNVAAGKYERYSHEYYEDEHILYNYLGNYEILEKEHINCSSIGSLEAGDAFLIGSDGAFGRMSERDIENMLSDNFKDEEDMEGFFLEDLFQNAREDKDDDQSAILYVVADEGEESQ